MKVLYAFRTMSNKTFAEADLSQVAYETGKVIRYLGLSFNIDLNGPFRWTPKIQKIQQSEEFMKKMKYFQRLQFMKDEHYSELIDTFIFEALKNTDFDYYYDYVCEPNRYCSFHGRLPFLIYNKVNQYPIIPVIKSKPNTAFTIYGKERDMLISEPVAAALWALTNSQSQKLPSVRVLQTDGNHWRMLELCTKERFKKTGVYCQRSDSYSKIYNDPETQQIVLGLIKYSLNQMSEKEQALNHIYDFIDERRYLTHEGSPAKPTSKLWKFVPESIKNFFF